MSILQAIQKTTRQHGRGSLQSGSVARRHTIQAPVGGWNTKDAYANMKPKYAIVLDNYFPEAGRVRLRRGAVEFNDGVGSGYVESLISHRSGSTKKLYAAGGGALYDVTSTGGGTSVKSGLSGNRWQSASMNGHTILVNGEDAPVRIEPAGTLASAHCWAKETNQPGTLVPSSLYRVMTFKGRMFFLEKDTAKLWYGDVGAIQGDLHVFRLDRVHPAGGNAIAMGTMTIDAGSGVDDLFCVFMSSGAVLVYQGTDISSATGWNIVGIWEIGTLVGDRPLVKFGGDLIAITTDGYIKLSKMLTGGRMIDRRSSLSDAIAPAVTEQVRLHGLTPGWDCVLHTPATWLLFSIPVFGGEQHVMNTQTGAWCRFTGWDARCWARHDDKLYYGGEGGKVYQADFGADDDGAPIEGDVQSAYNYLGSADDKRFTMARALVEADGDVAIRLGTTTDFNEEAQLSVPTEIISSGAEWDTATWDATEWAGGTFALQSWQALDREGTAISMRVRSSTRNVRISYYASDIIAERTSGIL